jgi:serine/threonine protein kinase
MTQPLELFGTPDFVAPEQVGDPRTVGAAADVYALGRIAAWGTTLKRGEGGPHDHPFAAWWRRLIDGATAYDPEKRWTMTDVETHLRSRPPREVSPRRLGELGFDTPLTVSRGDACPYCQSTLGRDNAERCLRCHVHLPY